MSTLAWIRLDTAMPRNHKILTLVSMKDGQRAAFAYVCSLAYAGEQGTDGFVPEPALPMIHAKPNDVQRLLEVGLWHARPGGYEINDWADYQQTSAETDARTKRAKAAAAARWGKAAGNA